MIPRYFGGLSPFPGEERVREEVEQFAAEIDAGEEVLNRAAALTARLKRLAGED